MFASIDRVVFDSPWNFVACAVGLMLFSGFVGYLLGFVDGQNDEAKANDKLNE